MNKTLEKIYDESEELSTEIELAFRVHEMLAKTVQWNNLDEARIREAYNDAQTLSFVLTDKLNSIKKMASEIVNQLIKIA